MPQIVGLVMVGAGLFAAYKARAEEELRRRAAPSAIEKDLGALEWDDAQQVYRPKRTG